MMLGIAALALKVAFVSMPRATSASRDVHGAYHVHSLFSDGHGDVDAIADAAASRGLDFVILTDHNSLHPEVTGLHRGVLFVEGVENSTAFGHLIALDVPAPLDAESLSSHGDPIAQVRQQGGEPILAHPLNLRNPWRDWAHADAIAGLEVLSYDDLWREALHDPLGRGLLPGLLELPFNPTLAALQIVRRPDAALARYDELRRHTDVALLCAPDAHGVPMYGPILDALVMHVDLARPLKAEQAPLLGKALTSGHAFCALESLAPAAGFHFEVTAQQVRVTLPVLEPRLPVETRLFRDGAVVATGTDASLVLPSPPPGDYRVEVSLPLPGALWDGPRVPWILSQSQRLP